MTTVDQILADAKSARRCLADLEQELQEEIDEIRFRAFFDGRSMTDEEQAVRNSRRAAKAEARAAYIEMTFVTLQRINQTAELQQLKNKMDEINAGLKDDLNQLKSIARYAEVAADVADSVEKVAKQVVAIAV